MYCGQDYCTDQEHVNMNEQDMIEWGLVAVVEVTVFCVMHYFLETFFWKGKLIARVLCSFPSSFQLILFRMLEMHLRCVCP